MFHVVSQKSISHVIQHSYDAIECIVKSIYISHDAGETINPDSYFLRFPERPNARIIALPASINNASISVSGIKWIASYPDNIKLNKQRASAVLILNDIETGYPLACLESSLISAFRTAASATLGAYYLSGKNRNVENIGIIGTGFIAKNISDFLINTGWEFDAFNLHDLNKSHCRQLSEYISEKYDKKCIIRESAEEICSRCNLIFFATTSSKPYFRSPSCIKHNPTIIHISLRDISEEIINKSINIVDDIDHCFKAGTSLHLAEIKYKNRNFVNGTIADLINGSIKLNDNGKPKIFSPFGMGILDLGIGHYVLSKTIKNGSAVEIPNFFDDTHRF